MITSDLSQCGLIAITGEDAQAFLHAQFTSDVNALALNHSQYSGYCTPKGRLLASFLLWRDEQGYFMELPAELREPIQKRLSMYILRSKVKMRDASGEFACFGVAGEQAAANLKQLVGEVPRAPHEVTHHDGITVIRLPAERFTVVVARQKAEAIHKALAANAKAITTRYWDWLGIRTGIAIITPATQEEFVPQMVNFDAIGAVSFNKGCYPGQEIVARMHYLGPAQAAHGARQHRDRRSAAARRQTLQRRPRRAGERHHRECRGLTRWRLRCACRGPDQQHRVQRHSLEIARRPGTEPVAAAVHDGSALASRQISRFMTCSYYIYYRVAPDKAEGCAPKIKELFAAVKQATGVAGRLLKKRGEPLLWMEIYENVSDEAKFEWEIADIADRLKIKDDLVPDTTRHVECFEIG